MKLFVITCLVEFQKEAAQIFRKAGISVFSSTGIKGFKEDKQPSLADNWFSSGSDAFESLVLFSFTDEEKSIRALELVHQANTGNDPGFPMRAFILGVEKSIV